MIRMPNATTMVIITAKGMSAVIITGKALTAAMKRETKAAAAITASKTAVRSAK